MYFVSTISADIVPPPPTQKHPIPVLYHASRTPTCTSAGPHMDRSGRHAKAKLATPTYPSVYLLHNLTISTHTIPDGFVCPLALPSAEDPRLSSFLDIGKARRTEGGEAAAISRVTRRTQGLR